MKYFTLILGLMLFVSCAHVSTTSLPVNFTGKWKGAVNVHDVNLDFDFNFKCDGRSLTGTAREKINNSNKSMKIENGKIDGKNISFTVDPGAKHARLHVKYVFGGEYIGENTIKLSIYIFPVTSHIDNVHFTIERVY